MNIMFTKIKNRIAAAVATVFTLAIAPLANAAEVTLPEVGVDVAGHISAAIISMGSIVTVAVGGWFAFILIRKALMWARRAF